MYHVIISSPAYTLYNTDNFFFREERANILSESTKKTEDGGDGEPTSFEDIGRIIGQRWRAIDPEELAKYKEMAKKDSDRYRDEMKSFYNDELTLMCLGHNNEGAAGGGGGGNPEGNNGQPQDVAGAQQMNGPGGMMGNPQQMPNLLQQQQQQAMMNDLALRQDLMVMLAQERARAGMNGMNPYGQPLPMNVGSNSFDPMGSMVGPNNNVMNDDQILQLLMLQQQGAGATPNGQPAPPNEACVKIALSQKNAIQECLAKISHETKTLQIKGAIMDKILSKELGPGAQGEESKSSSELDSENLSVEELFQLLQQQAASGMGVSNPPAGVGGPPQPPAGGNPMGGGGPGGPSMQEILLRQQQQNQPPSQMNPAYLAQFMASQAPGQQQQQMFDLNGMQQGMGGLPQGMGMMPNGGAPPGAVPGPGGNGVSAEDMIKKLMAEQNGGQAGNR